MTFLNRILESSIKFSIAGYITGHLPAPSTDLHETRGKIVSFECERVFQNLHRKLAEEM